LAGKLRVHLPLVLFGVFILGKHATYGKPPESVAWVRLLMGLLGAYPMSDLEQGFLAIAEATPPLMVAAVWVSIQKGLWRTFGAGEAGREL
jgi:hypothetical protein